MSDPRHRLDQPHSSTPEQYVPEVSVTEHSGDGPDQWVEGETPESLEAPDSYELPQPPA